MYHCEDCLVCIEDYDHHCVFFSKCIGGGNLKCFWGSMVMLLVNFILVASMVAFAAIYETEQPVS
jgi:large-conductance mechanosensitive channel